MKTVLLTGANGFLGGHLCRELLRCGYAVRAFVRPNSDQRVLDGLPLDIWRGDLRDVNNVRAATYGCDFVIHAGAQTQVNPARSRTIIDVNVGGTAAVLEAAAQANVERLVFVGAANAFGFGTKQDPGDESFPYMGARYGLDYMDSKCLATNLVVQAARHNRLPAVLVHPTFMLGPLDYKITSNALMLALYRKQIAGIPTGGRNFVHVDDVAVATVNALTMGRIGQSYILGNENLSYRELFTIMADVMHIQPPSLPIPPFLASMIGQISDWQYQLTGQHMQLNSAMVSVANDCHYFTVTKALLELNLGQTPVRTAIEEGFNWFRSNGYIDSPEMPTRASSGSV